MEDKLRQEPRGWGPIQSAPFHTGLTREAVKEVVSEVMQQFFEKNGAFANSINSQKPPEWYGITELAQLLNRAPFTVREWCRNGRLNAKKKRSGRGNSCEWVVSHEEVQRYLKEGLLPRCA